VHILVTGNKYPNIQKENRDNTGINGDISGIFQGYFRDILEARHPLEACVHS